jgi:outer membrane receptor protein involved in Fe transport
MLRKHRLTTAVSTALGLGAVAGLPGQVLAQNEAGLVEEVIVTGSRIQQANLVTASPVTQIDAEEFRFQGTTRVEDLMRNMPQVYSNQNSSQSNGATGTATLNLRNLGDARTLVLVNGRRLPVGSPLQAAGADINQIPAELIERVEVMTGGASATYGSDAVAGVVNFMMKDDFEGVQFDYQGSTYYHDNDNQFYQDLVSENGFPVPSGTVSDGEIENWSLIMGGNFDNGRGNITAYATYREVQPVLQSARDYSSCALNNTGDGCFGSGTSREGTFIVPGIADAVGASTFFVQGDELVPGNRVYNYGPLNYYQRPDERYTAGLFGRYEINDRVEVYTELSFMDNQTNAQIAPSGSFGVTNDVSCSNPFLSPQQVDLLCNSVGLGPDDTQSVTILRRNVEGGPRNQDLRHTTFRGVFGLRGDLNDTWRYDIYGLYSEVSMENTYNNDLSNAKILEAVDAVRDEESGEIVCRSGNPDCVPWNVWQTGGVDPAAPAFLELPLFARGTTEQKVFSGYVAGSLGDYGLKLPMAERGIEVVLGAEYREDTLTFNPDEGFRLGLGAGQGGATLPVNGKNDVVELFMEASVPLIEGKDFAEEVTLDLGYRYSDYALGGTTDTYGIRGAWAVNQDVKFRASFQRAVRAPNVRELFLPQGLNLFDMAQDPCTTSPDGNPPTATLQQCLRTGLPAEQYDNFNDSFAGQYNFLQGGNPDLEPEESDTWSAGIVFSPSFIEGLTVSVDYWQIEIENGISNLTPQFIIDECIAGNDELCGNIQRGPLGDLWLGSGPEAGRVVALQDNLAIEEVSGWDLVADYSIEIGDLGMLTFNNNMSIIDQWDQQEVATAPVISCEGSWGGTCGYPTLDFRNNLRATWITPWGVTASVLWRHLAEVEDLNGNLDLPSMDYFDLSAIYELNEMVTLRGGINNIADEEPPIAGNAAGPSINGNGNVFPGMYDALGRYMFVGATLTF